MFEPYEEPAPPARPESANRWRCSICDEVLEGDAPPDRCPVCGADASQFVAYEPEEAPTSSGRGHERIVIVGGGIAALSAAESARPSASDAAITLVHNEPDPPYNRLNLTRLLAGEVSEDQLPLRDTSWYTQHRIDLVAGDVAGIDRQARAVELRDGTVLGYDRLILANGAHPFVPPIPGAERDEVLSLRTKAHAAQMLARVRSGTRCICIGGGLLGLETAGALARRGAEVTVLEGFEWLLPRQLSERGGQLLRTHIEALGVTVRCGVNVGEILGDEKVRGVSLKDGPQFPADLVVLATGVRPNSHLARQCGLVVQRGVVVDDRMCTSAPEIYAAGDVCEHRGVVYGLWPGDP
jgi:nitrite reductase (NADH) large subunit